MNIDLIPAGDNPPQSVNVVIEVPIGGEPVKYEFDKKSGAIFVDRILHTAMRYPANYGFIPQTLGEDGDPLDCLVMARWPFMPGCVVRARPVGGAVPGGRGRRRREIARRAGDQDQPLLCRHHGRRPTCRAIVLQQIEHFFTHYKDLEPEKWVRVGKWGEPRRRLSRDFAKALSGQGKA